MVTFSSYDIVIPKRREDESKILIGKNHCNNTGYDLKGVFTKMKRKFALKLLALTCVAALSIGVFTGCGSDDDKSSTTNSSSTESDSQAGSSSKDSSTSKDSESKDSGTTGSESKDSSSAAGSESKRQQQRGRQRIDRQQHRK